jgi:hypothetical protein
MEKALVRFKTLSDKDKAVINAWILKAKEHFYDNRPYGNFIPAPRITGFSSRMMYELLWREMDYDQTSSPPHTPR